MANQLEPIDVTQRSRQQRNLRFGIVVLAIFALLAIAAVAVRVHHRQTLRAQVGAAIASADGTRVAVAIYHSSTGAWPPDNIAAGLLAPSAVTGKYVDNVHIENGKIVITLGAQSDRRLRGAQVELMPYLDGALVRWHCASRDVAAELLSENCR